MDFPDVRRAQQADRDRIGDLWLRLLREQASLDDRFDVAEDALERWENDFPMWLDDETARVYVAERDQEIVGFASARRWGPAPIYKESSEVFLDELYVQKEARRQGLGTQLLRAVREWTDRLGAERIRLNVLTANDAGRAFWDAQEAVPMTMTFTIECSTRDTSPDDEGSKKIGF